MLRIGIRWLIRVLFGTQLLLGCAVGMAGECSVINELPGQAQQVASGELDVSPDYKYHKAWTTEVYGNQVHVLIENLSNDNVLADGWMSWPKRSFNPACRTLGTIAPGRRLILEGVGFNPTFVNVTVAPGSKVKVTVFTNGREVSGALPSDVKRVTVPLEVFIVSGPHDPKSAKSQVIAAVEIWKKAGVVFLPRYKTLTPTEIGAALELDCSSGCRIGQTFSCSQRFDEPGFRHRTKLAKLKTAMEHVGVFFIDAGSSYAEPEYKQAYISPIYLTPIGRTVAHELGHVLLGDGHTGKTKMDGPCDSMAAASVFQKKVPVPWTSGLMESPSTSTYIADEDAKLAIRSALQMTGARWW